MGKRKKSSSRLRPPKKGASCPCGYSCGYYFLRCDNCHRGCHFQCLGLKVDEARQLNVYVCPTCVRSGVEAADVEEKCRVGNKPRAVVYEVLCNVHAEYAAQKEKTQKCYAIGYDLEDCPPLKDDACCICGCVCKSQLVSCDRCNADFHCMCVGLSEKDVDGIDEFFCPKCLAANPQLRITYKNAGEAPEDDHAEAADQPGPSGTQTGPATNTHSSGQHTKRVRREVCVKSEQPDEDATAIPGVSQSNRAASSTNPIVPDPQPSGRPVDDVSASGSSKQALRESAASASGRLEEPKTENGTGPSVAASSDHADDPGNDVQEPTAADLMRVLYERQVDDKQKEIDALRGQLRLKDADLEAERATRTQAQEENTRLKQENAKKDKTIVDLTMELFELKHSQ